MIKRIIAIVFILIIIGMFGLAPSGKDSPIGGFITLLALGLVGYIFGNAAGWWQSYGVLSFLADPDIQATFLIIAVFWIIISTITKEENSSNKSGFAQLGEFFGKMAENKEKK